MLEFAAALFGAFISIIALTLIGIYGALCWMAERFPKGDVAADPAYGYGIQRGHGRNAGRIVAEIALAALLHPIAVVLMWLDLARREDLKNAERIVWGVSGLLWGIGPVLYVLIGKGRFW